MLMYFVAQRIGRKKHSQNACITIKNTNFQRIQVITTIG